MAARKKTGRKKTTRKKPVRKKAPRKKTARKKTPRKKTARKKPVRKKAPRKKTTRKKTARKKTARKKPVRKKAPRKKTTRKKVTRKKAGGKKTTRKKTASRKTVQKKTARKKASSKKVTRKKTVRAAAPKPTARANAPASPTPIASQTPPTVAAAQSSEVGVVTHYFPRVDAAVVTVGPGRLHTGDTVHFRGHTTDFYQTLDRRPPAGRGRTTRTAGGRACLPPRSRGRHRQAHRISDPDRAAADRIRGEFYPSVPDASSLASVFALASVCAATALREAADFWLEAPPMLIFPVIIAPSSTTIEGVWMSPLTFALL